MKQIITIQGTPIETYDDSVIQLDYKSNILGEIDKIETCHSYTYAIPNTTKYRDWETDRKSTRLNSSHSAKSRMPSSA